MQLLGRSEAFAVQHRIHIRREHVAGAIALLPGGTKAIGILAPAVETRPMSRREGSSFIEKEQLGPALPLHHLAPAATKFQDTSEPGVGRPAFPEQRLR